MLNGSSTLQHFEHGRVVEIHNGITFNFYLGLPHIYVYMYRYNIALMLPIFSLCSAVLPVSQPSSCCSFTNENIPFTRLADIVITNFECIFLCQTFLSMYIAHVATMVGDIIGASASEPHTSEFNGGISMCHTSYVQCMCTRDKCGQYACDLTTHAYQDVLLLLSWGSRRHSG